jgi:uncharacterized protein (DUF1697 family)
MVAMSDLRELATVLGLGEPRTLLQSGNLVFESDRLTGEPLERLLQVECKKRLGLETDVFVRTAKEWRALVSNNPFPDEATKDPSHLLVLFLRAAPTRKAVDALQSAIVGPERVRAVGREAFIVYPDGIGRSRLTNTEKHMGRGTARNWNTILKLADAIGG